jgi:hypothetical protein
MASRFAARYYSIRFLDRTQAFGGLRLPQKPAKISLKASWGCKRSKILNFGR